MPLLLSITSSYCLRGMYHASFFYWCQVWKSKVGGRLRDVGGDLYDIRRWSAAFGRFVGAGRRLRGVFGPAGLDRPRLT